MRKTVLDRKNGVPADPTLVYKAIADEAIKDLRYRLKDPCYCKRSKLKQDSIDYCKNLWVALVGFTRRKAGTS